MENEEKSIVTLEAYFAQYTPEQRQIMQQLREAIHAAVPGLSEKISWGMPTFVLGGNIIHFAMNKNHVGIYPGAETMAAFAPRLSEYKTSKGALQLPLNKPIPYGIVAEMAKFSAKANRR